MGEREKEVGEKEKGREMLSSTVQFHVVALPSGRGDVLRALGMPCLRLNGSSLAGDSTTGINLLVLDTDEHIFAYTVCIMHSTSNNAAVIQSSGWIMAP